MVPQMDSQPYVSLSDVALQLLCRLACHATCETALQTHSDLRLHLARSSDKSREQLPGGRNGAVDQQAAGPQLDDRHAHVGVHIGPGKVLRLLEGPDVALYYLQRF